MGILLTAVSGWVLVVLLATTIALPYSVRRATSGLVTMPFLERLRPHFWLGYALAPITVAHLWPAMSQGWLRQSDPLGLYLASLALVLTVGQVWLGLRLRTRPQLRRVHFWTMAGIAGFSLGHVGMNSATLRVLFG